MEMFTPETKFPFLVFDNVLNNAELESAWEELNYLDKFISLSPEESGSAFEQNKKLKSNKCLWLTEFYNNPQYSSLCSGVLKITTPEVVEKIAEYDNSFLMYPLSAHNNTKGVLVSKYEDGDYYEPHFDVSIYTAILWLYKEPKSFDGGEFGFLFNGEEIEVESKPNRMVLFPSCYYHYVKPIAYSNEESSSRYSVSFFISYV